MSKYLYRGSKNKLRVFKPEDIHQSDFHKFTDDIGNKKVVWATSDKEVALCHGAFSGRTSYGVSSRKGRIYAYLFDLDWKEILDLNAKFFLYTFDRSKFRELRDSPHEFVSTEEVEVISAKDYKVENIFDLVDIYGLKLIKL